MVALIAPGDPGIDLPAVVDGIELDLIANDIEITPEPVSDYLDMLDGGSREYQRRPHFDGIANLSDRYTISIPYEALKGDNRQKIELIRARGGVHRVVLWRMVPTVWTLRAGVNRLYFPRFRKCAAWLYDGLELGGGTVVDTETFPTIATLAGEALAVTYVEGPELVSPGAGGVVISRQPDASGAATDYTALLLGDDITDGDELIVWTTFSFEMTLRSPRVRLSGTNEHHTHTFVEL